MVDCELDLNAILTDNSAGGGPALLFVYLFYHQPFVTSVTKTSKTGLPLFLSAKGYLGISKSETDPAYLSVIWGIILMHHRSQSLNLRGLQRFREYNIAGQ